MHGADSDPFVTCDVKYLDFVAIQIFVIIIIMIIITHSLTSRGHVVAQLVEPLH